MVGVAILYPEVSRGHREGDLKEEQSQGGRGGGRGYLEESVSGRRTARAKAPRWGYAGDLWREEASVAGGARQGDSGELRSGL